MEISQKLTRANSLNATVVSKEKPEAEASVSSLKAAANNNSDAATDISRLTTNQDSAAVAAANLSSSKVSLEDVDNLAKKLADNIKGNRDQAFGAIRTDISRETISNLLR